MDRKTATATLKAKGLRKFYSVGARQYWGFDEANSLYDHSATITKIGSNYIISDFTNLDCTKYPTPEEFK